MTWFNRAFGFIRRVVRRLVRDACPGRAAGLAFSTIFALVPLTAVVVALLSTFGTFDPVLGDSQLALLKELVPAASDQILNGLAQFSSNARTLGVFGLGLYVVTGFLLLRSIHTSFNAVWRFRSQSGMWRVLSTYTAVLVIATALLAAATVAGPFVQSLVGKDPRLSGWLRRVSEFVLPPLLLFLTIFLTIVLVPSGRVAPITAAIGAVAAVVGWEVAKRVFVFWTGSVMRLSVIYGSLAAVPIFLIWLYVTWLIVLTGVEIAYVVQHPDELTDETGNEEPAASLVDLSEYTLRALASIFIRFRDGMPPLTLHDLDVRYGKATAESIRDGLSASGIVLDTSVGFVPARDLATIDLNDVIAGLWAGDGDDRIARATLEAWRGVTAEASDTGESRDDRTDVPAAVDFLRGYFT